VTVTGTPVGATIVCGTSVGGSCYQLDANTIYGSFTGTSTQNNAYPAYIQADTLTIGTVLYITFTNLGGNYHSTYSTRTYNYWVAQNGNGTWTMMEQFVAGAALALGDNTLQVTPPNKQYTVTVGGPCIYIYAGIYGLCLNVWILCATEYADAHINSNCYLLRFSCSPVG
jgi:hypothetical protein